MIFNLFNYNLTLMLYPTDTIEELMPDMLIAGSDQRRNLNHKNHMEYFTKGASNTDDSEPDAITKRGLEPSMLEHVYEGTKGAIPSSVKDHPEVEYFFRGTHITLNGLNNAISTMVVDNGSWKP